MIVIASPSGRTCGLGEGTHVNEGASDASRLGLPWGTSALGEGTHVNEGTSDPSRPGLPWGTGGLGEGTHVSEDTGDDSHTETALEHLWLR
ncbi:hypothetical protein NDU88_000279 [Pleurodeles waltl]|uniref:Uncharacterized protein n=1 Tax=Pleurodeles waltl TaxID=8319 RepID=A0AAV7L9G4_PLEWA|nr:hypothetical protein NDU88_000279 [Pleurodeles waltl]